MTTIPNLLYTPCRDSFTVQLLATPLPASANLFEVTDFCTGFVNVLLETNDPAERIAILGRLSQAFTRMAQLCDDDLPPELLIRLTTDELLPSSMPDLWHDTCLTVGYLQSLTQALLGNTLAKPVADDLAGLLHDMVYIVRDYVQEPYLVH
ncbi:hypothetical protein [Leclercia sp. UBA1284]|uniref:hypothetical protein n=1 Tax=Leclercia sp. UBA1284 TaxID=1946737 RepID=UPI00257B3270|nr:hypothetical protein [Leclercia sp. UBA1284]